MLQIQFPVNIRPRLLSGCITSAASSWCLSSVGQNWVNHNFSGLSGRARKHLSNVLTLPDLKIFDMASSWSSGRFFDETNWHCYLTVIRAVFNINNQSTWSVINKFVAFRSIFNKSPAIFFSCIYIWGMFPSSAGKPRELAIWVRALVRRSKEEELDVPRLKTLCHYAQNLMSLCSEHYVTMLRTLCHYAQNTRRSLSCPSHESFWCHLKNGIMM